MNNDLANLVRSKSDIVDIIGERIPLVARGKNFFGVCPFHDDSNPSMCVSREKQIYTCFSCHATGNVFTFLMNYEHIDFRETLKYLGEKVGVNEEKREWSINLQNEALMNYTEESTFIGYEKLGNKTLVMAIIKDDEFVETLEDEGYIFLKEICR